MDPEQKIIHSWHANAGNWIDIIKTGGIESRKLVTNRAIVETVLAAHPSSVLDIGCGEGWLAKEIADRGIRVCGIDIVPVLVEKAKENTAGNFFVASYEDMSSYACQSYLPVPFDLIVINFALIGKESTERLLGSLPRYLQPAGRLLIQTLHPHVRKGLNDYVSGWKKGSWDGLGPDFTLPYEWYFRTLRDWLQLLESSGFDKIEVISTTHPACGLPLSVIFQCSVKPFSLIK